MPARLKGKKALAAAVKKPGSRAAKVRSMMDSVIAKVYAVELVEAAPGEERAAIRRRAEVLAARSPERQSKYHNRKVVDRVEGTFDSQAEFKRWGELKWRVRAQEIQDLRRQVPFSLDVQGQHLGDYVADFVYLDRRPGPQQGKHVVEDVKGVRTEMFKWKAKHVRAQYGISIVEIKA